MAQLVCIAFPAVSRHQPSTSNSLAREGSLETGSRLHVTPVRDELDGGNARNGAWCVRSGEAAKITSVVDATI